MSPPDATGSFWRCPSCKKPVPSRQNTCRCGFDREQAPGSTEELRVDAARAVATDESTGFQWRGLIAPLALLLVLAGAGYWAYTSWKTPFVPPEQSELPHKIREARVRQGQQQPQVVYVPVPIGQDPKSNQPTSASSPPPVSQPTIDSESFQTLPPKDRELAKMLAATLANATPPSLVEIVQAEALFARHADQPAVSLLFRSLVVVSADRLISANRVAEAKQILERGAKYLPSDPDIQRALIRAADVKATPSPTVVPTRMPTRDTQAAGAHVPIEEPTFEARTGLDAERDKAWFLWPALDRVVSERARIPVLEEEYKRDCSGFIFTPGLSRPVALSTTPACQSKEFSIKGMQQSMLTQCAAIKDSAHKARVLPGILRDLARARGLEQCISP